MIRGADLCAAGFDRVTADQMGMLATVINGLALRDASKENPFLLHSCPLLPFQVLLINMIDHKAQAKLQQGKVVIFSGWTGNPLVTTDSAAALRGIEIGADIVLKATKVEGVFDDDPIKNPKAERYQHLTYDEVISKRLRRDGFNRNFTLPRS